MVLEAEAAGGEQDYRSELLQDGTDVHHRPCVGEHRRLVISLRQGYGLFHDSRRMSELEQAVGKEDVRKDTSESRFCCTTDYSDEHRLLTSRLQNYQEYRIVSRI